MCIRDSRRGVTQEQAKRVKKLYEQQNGSADKDANATMQNRNRLREKTKTQEDIYVTENFTFDQRPVAGGVVGKNLSDSVSANRYYEGMGKMCIRDSFHRLSGVRLHRVEEDGSPPQTCRLSRG